MDWIKKVKTVSTFPPDGTFTKSGPEIAEIMSRKSVSPRGYNSAINMVVFYKNRAGRKLSLKVKRNLDEAVKILRQMKEEKREQPP